MSAEEAAGESILVSRPQADVCLVTLARPARLNALTREMVARLNGALDAIAADATCRAVILTGAGRGFCSGQDMQAANQRNRTGASGVIEKLHWQEQFAGIGRRLRAMPQLVVAAVNGPAVGAGMALALAADVRLASPAAQFLVAAVRIGLTGGESGLSYLLPRMIGAARAFDILLTGRPLPAAEAERLGLVLALHPPEALVEAALAYARQVLANSPYAVAHTKKLMWENLDAASFEAALAAENRTQILGTFTEDYGEATAAFLEKRPPAFCGR
ncbi:MAG TPA: enoyl-CoA hydratase-related protein [Novosphingobium sp.]|nr:enoyl-CoA hydratase-related protein [Novosphingobium sp.]